MSKVKYRSFRKSEETLWRSSLPENEVEKPINWSNTPEGYYYIRGNKQGHYKDYIYIDNKWYLLNDQRFEVLKNKCDRVTTGNCSHHIATIKGMCTRNIEFIEKCGIEE